MYVLYTHILYMGATPPLYVCTDTDTCVCTHPGMHALTIIHPIDCLPEFGRAEASKPTTDTARATPRLSRGSTNDGRGALVACCGRSPHEPPNRRVQSWSSAVHYVLHP